MTTLESLQGSKRAALFIKDSLLGSNVEKVRIAESPLDQMVDRFYAEIRIICRRNSTGYARGIMNI